jgi:hypothetical protein
MCEMGDGVMVRLEPTVEAFVSDPMIRLVMASDGVTVADMHAVLRTARAALCARAAASGPSELTPAA